MGLETAQYVEDLNPLWPLSTDKKQEGDDHLRLLKSTLQNMTADQAQVTAKTDQVWLSPAALGMDIDFTGEITNSGEAFATLGSNTFTDIQTAPEFNADVGAGLDSNVRLRNNGLNNIILRAQQDGSGLISKYGVGGSGVASQLFFNEDGTINVAIGQIQQGGVDVATVGANTFTGNQIIQTNGASSILQMDSDALFNSSLIFKTGGVTNFSLLAEDSTGNLDLRKFSADGLTTVSVLRIGIDGTINAAAGQLQQAGENVPTLAANNLFTGTHLTLTPAAGNAYISVRTATQTDNGYFEYYANGIRRASAIYIGSNDQLALSHYTTGAAVDAQLTLSPGAVNVAVGDFQIGGKPTRLVQGGYVNAAGTTSYLPSGWSVVKGATGTYTFTHNQGLTSPFVDKMSVTVTALNGASTVCSVQDMAANSFVVKVWNSGSATAADADFNLVVTQDV